MAEYVYAVRADEYVERVGDRSFIGLPSEEIERLHATLDVLPIDRETAANDATYLPLVVFTAIHYNYSWLVQEIDRPSLGIGEPIAADGEPPPFLDPAFERFARRAVQRVVTLSDACQWRLAGLIRDHALALVYVARLPQRAIEPHESAGVNLRFCRNGELITEQSAFDPRSQLLIDNLHAF